MAASRKNHEIAEREDSTRRIFREWIQQRIAKIHERVTIYDVLRHQGIDLDHEDRAEQFSCPVHGKDTNPSARAYPASGSGPSHAWCFVCQERWDAISLWKRLYGGPEKKFTRILSEIEVNFGLDRVAFPEGLGSLSEEAAADAEEEGFEAFHKLEAACENRLRNSKRAFTLKSYTSSVSLLERVGTRVIDRRMGVDEGESRLRALLENIGKKVRECPDV